MIERLEIVRNKLGLNQLEFATALGLQPGSYSDIKSGKLKSGISKKTIIALNNSYSLIKSVCYLTFIINTIQVLTEISELNHF
jgi:transcriptional regulator with XRE-family HTH domain